MPMNTSETYREMAKNYESLSKLLPSFLRPRRRSLTTPPADYSREEIAAMLRRPNENEKPLRAVSAALAASTKTYDLILQTYQDILSYTWYIHPCAGCGEEDQETVRKNYAAAYRIARTLDPVSTAHELVGLCMQYGKVFCTPRVSVDVNTGEVEHAWLQQLPMDYCRIVGRNNGPGKYTVEFDPSYFLLPGTDPSDYGNLFDGLLIEQGEDEKEKRAVEREEGRKSKNTLLSLPHKGEGTAGSEWHAGGMPEPACDRAAARGVPPGEGEGLCVTKREAFNLNPVILPPDKVIVFEINDRTDAAVPPLTGMFTGLTRLPDFEYAQLEAVLSPLTAVLTGSLETSDPSDNPASADPVRVSPTVRRLFETLWYRMLEQNNSEGIGIFLAPAKELKLQTLSDAVLSTNIATTAISDQILKAGLSSLIPTTSDPKVGLAEQSAKIAAQYAMPVCRTLERFFNELFSQLFPKTPLRFRMTGDIFSKEKETELALEGMKAGSGAAKLKYLALQDLSLLDAEAVNLFTGADKP